MLIEGTSQHDNDDVAASNPQVPISNPPPSQAHDPSAIPAPKPTPSAPNPVALDYAAGTMPPNSPTQGDYSTAAGISPPQGYNYPTGQNVSQNATNVIVVGAGPGTQITVTSDFNLINYLRNPTKYISSEDYQDAYNGAAEQILEVAETTDFLDAITCGKLSKLLRGRKTTLLKNAIRLTYFIFQFFYPIIVAIVKGGNLTYNVVCGIFALIGLVYDIINIVKECWPSREKKSDENTVQSNEGAQGESTNSQTGPNSPPDNNDKDADNKKEKDKKKTTSKKILIEFAKDMAEEIIIYPSLICNLYGFINERGWEFNEAIAVFDFMLTMISFFLDAFLTKIDHIWLLYQLIRSTTECQKKAGLHSYATPVNLTVPFSIGLTIAHTLMLCLISVRIYADNFNTEGKFGDDKKEPEEGDYTVTSYTSYMIFCGAYLPLMSAATYIIVNKHWFLQLSWILYNKEDAVEKMNYLHITSMPTRVKLFGFMRDKHAYLAVISFAPLFIAFYAGGYLNDYNSEDLPKGAQSAASTLCTLFVLVFSIINIQAGIIFSIIIIILMIVFCIICTGGGTSDVRKKIHR